MMKTPLQQHQQEEDDFNDTSTPEPEPPHNNSSSDGGGPHSSASDGGGGGGYYHSYDHASAFFSDPSISPEESEEIGSSIDDAQKKWLYRQHLRNAAAAAAAATGTNNTNGRQQQQQQHQRRISGGGGGGGDDDTSLSSSNLSPMPQRVVQLTSSNSDILFTERRNQIRAAARSPFLRLQSETSNSDGVSGMTDSMNRTNSEATMLEAAALLPPSLPFTKTTNNENETNDDHPATGRRRWKNSNTDTSSSNEAATATTDEEANNNGQHHHVTFFPSMPKLDSTDSLRGMDITSSGGESSTDNKNKINKNNNMTSSPPLIRGTTVEIRVGGENHNKKKSSPRKHKRQRSGDLVAATIMNPNGKDWIGMNRDNLPLPETPNPNNDDDSLLLPLPQQQDQHHESSSRIVDGRDTRVSSPPLYPYHTSNANGESSGIFSPGSSDRIFSPDSSERYHFSDSSGGGGVSNNTAYLHHQHFLHQQQTGYIVNPRHHHQHQQHRGQYHAVPMYDTYGYNPNNMQWYQPNYHIPEVYRRHRNDSEGDDSEEGSSYSGSGEGGGTTSSSYVTEDDEEDASKSTRSSSSSSPRSSSRDRNDVEIPPPHPFSISGHNKPPLFDTESPPEILIDQSSDSKFDQIMKKVTSVLDKPLYRPQGQLEIPDDKNYPTFFCPNCKTRQRAFLSVATASEQTSSPLGYLALYFALYMVSSLFIFGLEEGWQPLDCVYFSVITLTTAGLGDFVPTTDGAKIVCACFIYVGVATIGLLLGSLLAGSLDDATKKDAYNAQVKDCPNCQRLERLKSSSSRPMASSGTSPMGFPPYYDNNTNRNNDGYEEVGETAEQSSATSGSDASFPDVGLDLANNNDTTTTTTTTQRRAAPPRNGHTRHMSLLVSNSPKSRQKKSNVLPLDSALKKKSHTRHMSLANSLTSPPKPTSLPDGLDKIDESTPLMDLKRSEYSTNDKTTRSAEVKFCEESSYSTSSTDTSNLHPSKPLTRLKAAKYIFLTLNQALANSVFIIAAGSIGFYYIEKMSVVDSFYFTTVLLTSVGYGDIVPVTAAGKMFTTVFIIVAGTILLHNMTLISMIPLELRKRRIEHAVLGQFGDRLTDDELRELSTGTLVNRLKLATNRPDGLDECTREMFSLAMLVRLGRVTEEDVKATFAAFRRLDVGNYGRLNSRTIIEGELMRRRALSSKNLVAMSNESDWEGGPSPSNYSRGSYSQGGPAYAPYPSPYSQGPVPMYAPPHYAPGMYGGATPRSQYSSPDSPRTQYSETPNFNLDEYEQWASNWGHYDTLHHTHSH